MCNIVLSQFNCYEFTSDVVPFAEKKLASDLDLGIAIAVLCMNVASMIQLLLMTLL